ncbi:Apoptosis regulator Bcl-2 [Holothuria leucospilota]|uniref:Apoptosis regulator Bcl-2 n=1 Tax=Holothuria leucospilota TaxID=206669 RepID=A0A9Q1BP12_HOLLE|nr:Apoptosis regulator Bcl-2 [Holothuria leucospilota]
MDYMSYGEIARELGKDFVRYKVGFETHAPPSLHTKTLRRVGDEVEERHVLALHRMVQQLQYDPVVHGRKAVYATFDSIFKDGAYSWGRIVMVYVFAARLAKYCRTRGRDKIVVEDLGRYAGDYVAYHLKHWIEEQGGWVDHFCETFRTQPRASHSYIAITTVIALCLACMIALRHM